MKAHIGVDAESGLVHSLVGTAANVADVTQVDQLLHGEESYVSGDAGYTGVDKRPEHQDRTMIWSIAARPSSYKKYGKKSLIGRLRRKIEYAKAQVRAKVEHPFRVIKRQFGYTKVRYRGLMKNTAQQATLFALSNLWMMRKRLLVAGEVRLHQFNGELVSGFVGASPQLLSGVELVEILHREVIDLQRGLIESSVHLAHASHKGDLECIGITEPIC